MPPAAHVAADVEFEEKVDTPMDWEPIPPLITRSLTSSTDASSSDGSLPQTPIDEDIVMVDIFDADISDSDDSDSDSELEDKPTKSVPPPTVPNADVQSGGPLIASDSELERQLWADMNDILGHEDEPARFCGPYAEQANLTLADLPAAVPLPTIAQDVAFPFASNGQSAKAVPDVVVTPATPEASSLDALWEELFGPEC